MIARFGRTSAKAFGKMRKQFEFGMNAIMRPPRPVCRTLILLWTLSPPLGSGEAPLVQNSREPVLAAASSVPPGIDTSQNSNDLALVLMSEASIGNAIERESVGWTVINRMIRNQTLSVQAVWAAYAHDQIPAQLIINLAIGLLRGDIPDPTDGCTHFYSPRTMPKESAGPEELRGMDTGGGLEQVGGLAERNYRPGWVSTYTHQAIPGTRPGYYQFYKAPGNGPVR
jgi:hypothetical protein